MARWLAEQRSDLRFPANGEEWGEADVAIAHCPERVLPGNILHEIVHNDRVVGGLTPACSEAAVALYSSLVKGECIVTDARTAEMRTLTENSLRNLNIASTNEFSVIHQKPRIKAWRRTSMHTRHHR